MRRWLVRLSSLGLLLASLGTWVIPSPVLAQRVNLANTNQVYNTLARGNGGTGVTVATDDSVLVGNGTLWQVKAIPDCLDTAGQHLNYDASTNTFSCGTSGGGSGGAAEQTFSAGATGVTVTHTLGTVVVWSCYLGSGTSYTPMLVDAMPTLASTSTVFSFASAPSDGKCVVSAGGSGGGGSGTVTSVGLSAPAFLSVSGSPVTTTGTLALSLATQSANLVFSGPGSGGAATPTFRSLVANDIPSVDAAKIATGVLAPARVITGAVTVSRCLHVDGSGNITVTGADCNTGGGGGGGITAINSEVGPGITLASGSSGSDFAISAASNVITFNIPSAGPAERGLVTASSQSFAGTKTFLNKVAFSAVADPGCPGTEYSIRAVSGVTDRLKSCINGVDSQIGNVYSTTGGVNQQLARWLGSGAYRLDDGVAYSQGASASSIAQRTVVGGLVASSFDGGTGVFSAVSVSPGLAAVAEIVKRGTIGQTQDIMQWQSEASAVLSSIDKSGRFVGPVVDKAGQVFNVLAYSSSTINDGVTLARTAIQAAIDACQATTYGGVVYFPPGIYAIDGNLNVGNGNGNTVSTLTPCELQGAGAAFHASYTSWLGASVIKWTGAAPGATDYMVKMNGPFKGGGMSDIVLDANSKANLRGLLMEHVANAQSSNLAITHYTTIGLVITSRVDSPSITHGACGNKFYNLKVVVNSTGGSGMLLDGYDTAGGSDSCSNGFFGGEFWHDSGTASTYGVKLGYTDNNRFYDTNVFSFGGYGTGTISTSGVCPCSSVTGSGTTWTAGMTGARFNVNGVDYTFTYVSATSGTISPSAASTFTGASYTLRHGYGIQFAKASVFPGFPQENHFYSTSPHNGVGGTTGTGQPNGFTNWNWGDCSVNCDPYMMLGLTPATNAPPIVHSSAREVLGIGVIRQREPQSPSSYAGYWLQGEDNNGTQLYHLKRGAPSTNGLEIWSFDDIKFSNDGNIYHATQGNRVFYGQSYSSTSTNNYNLIFEKNYGTITSPSAIGAGAELGAIAASGRNSGGTQSFAHRINMVVDSVDGSAVPTQSSFDFSTVDVAGGGFRSQWKIEGSVLESQNSSAVLKLTPTAVGSLPTCNAGEEGSVSAVTDSNTATYNAAVAGGGANRVKVYCNGTGWVVQ
jgi:hypothetical protein